VLSSWANATVSGVITRDHHLVEFHEHAAGPWEQATPNGPWENAADWIAGGIGKMLPPLG
jgi:hypothetical protein